MYIRELKNRSGSISIQVISKSKGRYKVLKTIGCATTRCDIDFLRVQAKEYIACIENQLSLFSSETDDTVDQAMLSLSNSSIMTVGPELIFGRIYDHIGFSTIDDRMFRHLVIARLSYPLSKLKTREYLYRYQGIDVNISSIYRFLDKLNNTLKQRVEQIAFAHTKTVLRGKISVVFYDMTTLYFEASDEDDLRKAGFSKDGKHSNPQIFIGLLVGLVGYPIGYDIFEGNIYEGHTLIPFLNKMSEKFCLGKPVVIADSGLLSKKNITVLEQEGYQYIIGGRLKNETREIQNKITAKSLSDGKFASIKKNINQRLVIYYSEKRRKKDAYNRQKGLERLQKRVYSGKLTKSSINNRGYNKYLKMEGEVSIKINLDKFKADQVWDGLKGYITNTKLTNTDILKNYSNLWLIENAFRMSKTDLRIRPIYNRLRHRIEAHICIAFTAYSIYKELERVLHKEESTISVKTATELTHNIYRITYQLPESKQIKSRLLKMDQQQAELYRIIQENF